MKAWLANWRFRRAQRKIPRIDEFYIGAQVYLNGDLYEFTHYKRHNNEDDIEVVKVVLEQRFPHHKA